MSGRGSLIRKLLEESKISLDLDSITNSNTDVQPEEANFNRISKSPIADRKNIFAPIFQNIPGPNVLPAAGPSSGRGRALLLQRMLANISLGTVEGTDNVLPTTSSTIDSSKVAVDIKPTVEESDVENLPVRKHGNFGKEVRAVCNYIRLNFQPDKGVFEYEVRYVPSIDCRNMRVQLLNEHRNILGNTKTFDGVVLFLPIILPDKLTNCVSKHPVTNEAINISIIFKRKKPLKECIHLFNILFDRIMRTLKYVKFDRKSYDPTAPKIIPQWKLEVWPGYVTAVNEFEDGVMLCCDVSHRVLCQTTCLQSLTDAYRASPSEFQQNAKKLLLGSVVLTRYNNRTYRIDDVDFELTPKSTFPLSTGEVISYMDYYKKNYNIDVRDVNQPLLISIKKRYIATQEQPMEISFCLIPELCYLTGLRDDLRADFKVMRELATHTLVSPNQRVLALEKFHKNVNEHPEALEILQNWGLTLDKELVNVRGRQFPEESILFFNGNLSAGVNAEFSKQIGNNELLDIVHFDNWILFHTQGNTKVAKTFLELIQRNSAAIGLKVTSPKIFVLKNDRSDTYVDAIREHVRKDTQIVVCICPSNRDDRYSAIKRLCCSEIPIPSQVVCARTLANDSRNRAIVMNIALQMNCKLGGSLWSVHIPFKNVMICGIDSYHDGERKNNSVSAFVASLNKGCTKWYSRAVIQNKNEELINGICVSLTYALKAYKERNNTLPDKIIVFRDGVGDGQLSQCSNYEVAQFKQACKNTYNDIDVALTFIVVQKRINTKIFAQTGKLVQNPNPGFVVDNTVTRRYLYDYFLISQSVRQGTVTPSHYIVVMDESNFSPDILQRLSYKLCFMYYNWPGTIRVPACIQYAHKMAFLVGQSVKRNTADKLATKLFYL